MESHNREQENISESDQLTTSELGQAHSEAKRFGLALNGIMKEIASIVRSAESQSEAMLKRQEYEAAIRRLHAHLIEIVRLANESHIVTYKSLQRLEQYLRLGLPELGGPDDSLDDEELFYEVEEALDESSQDRTSKLEHRRALLRQAGGMWKDRDDLIPLEELREEWGRRIS